MSQLGTLSQRKTLLVSRLQLLRMETTLHASELREALRPWNLIGGSIAQPAAVVALIETVAPLLGLRRLARWARIGTVAFVAFRVLRNWRGSASAPAVPPSAAPPPRTARLRYSPSSFHRASTRRFTHRPSRSAAPTGATSLPATWPSRRCPSWRRARRPAKRNRGNRSACSRRSACRAPDRHASIIAQTTSFHWRMSMSSSVTMTNLVYMNCRRKLHTPNITRLACPGILLLQADDRHTVRAAFGRQIEVGDLGKLLLQQRHEDLVQRNAEDRRLVRRLAGIGAVIDRLRGASSCARSSAPENARPRCSSRCDRRTVLRRALSNPLASDESGRMWPSSTISADAGTWRPWRQAFDDLGPRSAQQSGELVFGQRVRHRRYRAEHRRRIGAERDGDRERRARMMQRVVAKIERPAAGAAASA